MKKMSFSVKYSFYSEEMRETNRFELITAQNLQRIGIRIRDIMRVEYFTSIPGPLYPEVGAFSAAHPAGGSFGAHLYLRNGREAWLYGRISYDTNPNRDHQNENPHWNHDIAGVRPNGETINPYRDFAYHYLPSSNQMQINISEEDSPIQTYTITRE